MTFKLLLSADADLPFLLLRLLCAVGHLSICPQRVRSKSPHVRIFPQASVYDGNKLLENKCSIDIALHDKYIAICRQLSTFIPNGILCGQKIKRTCPQMTVAVDAFAFPCFKGIARFVESERESRVQAKMPPKSKQLGSCRLTNPLLAI